MQTKNAGGRGKHGPRKHDRGSAAAVWRETESLKGKAVDAGVIILRTSGCRHFHAGGCSMCGYNSESVPGITDEDILRQFTRAHDDLGEVSLLKVYTSGSFLDECEVPSPAAEAILRKTADRGQRLLIESRPEFVTGKNIDRVVAINEDLEVAVGLESANDRVLKYSINKGFTVGDYDRAADVLKEKGVDLRTYVLLKPPFLTESEAVADAKATVAHASRSSSTISLNPVNVQRGTIVERLWKNWAYRPPWLWSVLEVLRSSDLAKARIICDPTGGGRERGAHNCGKCDDIILDSIRNFSLSQDRSRLGSPECSCSEVWQSVMDIEGFVVGGTCDLQRFFRKQ